MNHPGFKRRQAVVTTFLAFALFCCTCVGGDKCKSAASAPLIRSGEGAVLLADGAGPAPLPTPLPQPKPQS
jgi:hypothetical protein